VNDLELDERLRTDAARWNAARPPGPDLAEAIERLSPDAPPRRRTWRRPALAVAAAAVAVSAIAIAVEQIRPGNTNSANGKPLVTCGVVPTSNGPYASRVVLTLSAPSSAISGETIHPQLTIRAAGHRDVRGIDVGQPAAVYITRHSEIVGRYSGLVRDTGLGMTVTKEPTAIPAASLLLSGCPQREIDLAHPDASRQPLPPGRYQLVATLVSESRGHQWQLASEPSSITITN
jgi:hypothetical protein